MFGSMKKAMAVGAVVAVGALAGPAMASAGPTWSMTGSTSIGGSLSVAVGAMVTSCDVSAEANLVNGPDASGSVSSFAFNNCTSNVPGCAVVIVPKLSPAWAIAATSTSRVGIGGVEYDQSLISKPGSSCALAGVTVAIRGHVEGDFAGNVLSFESESGLAMYGPGLPPGGSPATVTGEVELFRGETPVELMS